MIITHHISNAESTLEGANGNGNSEGHQKHLADGNMSPEDTNAETESVSTATKKRADLTKKKFKKNMLTRNQKETCASGDCIIADSAGFEALQARIQFKKACRMEVG